MGEQNVATSRRRGFTRPGADDRTGIFNDSIATSRRSSTDGRNHFPLINNSPNVLFLTAVIGSRLPNGPALRSSSGVAINNYFSPFAAQNDSQQCVFILLLLKIHGDSLCFCLQKISALTGVKLMKKKDTDLIFLLHPGVCIAFFPPLFPSFLLVKMI